jgi:hypothetical protein
VTCLAQPSRQQVGHARFILDDKDPQGISTLPGSTSPKKT